MRKQIVHFYLFYCFHIVFHHVLLNFSLFLKSNLMIYLFLFFLLGLVQHNDIVKMFFCQKENMDNMLWLRPLMLAFLMAFRIGLTTPQEQQSDCQFPSRWKGTWYHSGFPHPLNISANHISSKGTCVQHQESMFIMVDR